MIEVAEVALTEDEYKVLARYAAESDMAIGEAAHILLMTSLPGMNSAGGETRSSVLLPIRRCS